MTVGNDNTVTSPKNAVFQIRLNQEVKSAAEDLFASCGLTLTERSTCSFSNP